MTDPLSQIGKIAASGLRAQSTRLRVVSENLANANTTATEPGGEPYRRKTVSFREMVNASQAPSQVRIDRIGRDTSPFTTVHDPSHPAADENGYLLRSNVNPLMEMADMREASRSFEANLNMIATARSMKARVLDMLKS